MADVLWIIDPSSNKKTFARVNNFSYGVST